MHSLDFLFVARFANIPEGLCEFFDMPVLIGCAICDPSGTILAGYDHQNYKQPDEFIGTKTFDWFEDKERAMDMFARAVIGQPVGRQLLDMDKAKVGDWVAAAHYIPTGIKEAPVLGAFVAFTGAVRTLSERELEVAKTYHMGIKEAAKALHLSPSTIGTLRSRIGEKLQVKGAALGSMLETLHDLL
jgi:DNA-binding CsgD family transcriptional regulator